MSPLPEKRLLGLTKEYVLVELEGQEGNLSPEERERFVRHEAYMRGMQAHQDSQVPAEGQTDAS